MSMGTTVPQTVFGGAGREGRGRGWGRGMGQKENHLVGMQEGTNESFFFV